MKRERTELGGITTRSSYKDGEMYSMLNLRGRNGSLQPVAPASEVGRLPLEESEAESIQELFEHRCDTYAHLIMVCRDAEGLPSIISWLRLEDNGREYVEEARIYDAGTVSGDKRVIREPLTSVEQNGHMLLFATSASQYYALWKDGAYKWYGGLPDLPVIDWTCMEELSYLSEPDSYGEQTDELTLSQAGVTGAVVMTDDELKTSLDTAVFTMRERLNKQYNPDYFSPSGGFSGIFHDVFLARYAFRLYDGSLVKMSPPILLAPWGTNVLDLTRGVFRYHVVVQMIADDSIGEGLVVDENWTEVLNSGNIFGTGGRYNHYTPYTDQVSVNSSLKAKAFVCGIRYDLRNTFEQYEGLIESVDLFLSPYLNVANDFTGIAKAVRASLKDVDTSSWRTISTPGHEIRLTEKITDGLAEKIGEMSTFYMVKSLKAGSYSVPESSWTTFTPFPSKTDGETILKIRNLVHQELLQDNDASIHPFGSSGTYSYNKRIHYYGIRQQYFGGFNWKFFEWDYHSRATNRAALYYNGTWNGQSFIIAGLQRVILEVEIENKGSVYSTAKSYSRLFGSAMLSYPDPSARKLTIYVQRPDDTLLNGESTYGQYPVQRVMTVPLKEHKALNLSYYLTPELAPVMLHTSEDLSEGEASYLLERLGGKVTSYAANELRVSEVGNPMEVLYQNILQVGNGRILNMGAVVMNVSERNFGQYPLFVFTESGIYALGVGSGEAAYTNIHPLVTPGEVVNNVICRTPSGIVYAGSNGLYLISGSSARLITPLIEESPAGLHMEYHGVMKLPLASFTAAEEGGDFKRYIRTADNMWYDPVNDELSIWRTGTAGWTACRDGVVYRNSQLPWKAVKNCTDKDWWVKGTRLLDMQSPHTTEADGSAVRVDVHFITRPLLFGTPDIKTLERLIIRGHFYDLSEEAGCKPVAVTWFSDDDRNFNISKGLRLKPGHHRDIDTGMYARRKFRSYMAAFGGKVGCRTKIDCIESEIEAAYRNTKMR